MQSKTYIISFLPNNIDETQNKYLIRQIIGLNQDKIACQEKSSAKNFLNGRKKKILSYRKSFVLSNFISKSKQDRHAHLESNSCLKRLRAGMTTGLIASPSKANWF